MIAITIFISFTPCWCGIPRLRDVAGALPDGVQGKSSSVPVWTEAINLLKIKGYLPQSELNRTA
ncbi:hypothetical protein M2281_002042 [Mesorhizobium soli]|jgi:hypothetical protein|uniref:hypothetical protein n=1 Tax=Pseudaminobacter soli (ex Li et al. 2025) TaxID=1295366 RepID=UPI002476C4C6|nr:hypothetical protein [Mesorhizobium soli]MDH6231470.1 hypothetical protein [Mesorhizobium soli]